MPTCQVIDLSHHQTIPKDLLEARAAGVFGCIHKLSEGSSYVDDKCQARHYLAQQAGMLWGIYHFMRPGNMKAQAEFFWNTANDLEVVDGDTLLVADHEDEGVSGQQLKEFLDRLEDLSDRSPVIYSGHVLKEQLAGSGYRPKRRLWLCQYAATPVLPEGVDRYWLWQYTDKGTVPGINPPTDCNTIGDQDEDEFARGWAGSHEGAGPTPEPDQQLVTVTIDAPDGVTVKVVINGRTV